ncbi:MAG: hypothetical protein P8Q99_07355, partial [Paracoccaceae bacterium]|nr:hypothetical protein [Paracoccaceae bacterium]
DPFGPVFVLISYPFKDYDEPKTLTKQKCRSVSKAVTGYKLHFTTGSFRWKYTIDFMALTADSDQSLIER